jgi:predicted phosphodiesterase
MRVALIADIHGNLPALEAVLAEIRSEAVDRIVCLGDVVSFGPQPREVIARLRALGCPVVLGNADADVLTPPALDGMEAVRRRLGEMDIWTHERLAEDERAYVRGFSPTVAIDLGGGTTLLCYHGSPRSFDERVLPETSVETLDEWFGGHEATIYAGGHTHLQMLRRHHKSLVLNPGSVGLPYEVPPPAPSIRNPAWAEYALVEAAGARLRVDLRRTPFDVVALLAAADASGMPHAEWWASDWVMPGDEK